VNKKAGFFKEDFQCNSERDSKIMLTKVCMLSPRNRNHTLLPKC